MTVSDPRVRPVAETAAESGTEVGLKRTIRLPLLVFYGVGVTVGAGIFALVGEILDVAGDRAPLAFLVAGGVAGLTGLCYTQLIARFPRAGGEAVYASRGLGPTAGRIAGLGVVATGTISSAVIAQAFAGYVLDLVEITEAVVVVGVIVALAAVAIRGIRESVLLAAVITIVEVGILVVVAAFGVPDVVAEPAVIGDALLPGGGPGAGAVFAGALVAFFAFVGFEDIANMAEETVDPRRTGPRAVVITLVVTVAVYVVVSLVAAAVPDRQAIIDSSAPMATVFEAVSGRDGRVVSAIAVVAMVNGILVQIVMAARVLYGMASEGLVPALFGRIDEQRQTPVVATGAVAVGILALALFFPLVGLARATSLVTLTVFTIVDLSLFVIGTRERHRDRGLARWRWVGLLAAAVSGGLAIRELITMAL